MSASGNSTSALGWRNKEQRSYFDFGGFPDYREVDLDVWSLTPRVKIDTPVFGRTQLTGRWAWTGIAGTIGCSVRIDRPTSRGRSTRSMRGRRRSASTRSTPQSHRAATVSAGARRERLRMMRATASTRARPVGRSVRARPLRRSALRERVRAGYALSVPRTAAVIRKPHAASASPMSTRFRDLAGVHERVSVLEPQTARSHELGVEARRGAQTGARATFSSST